MRTIECMVLVIVAAMLCLFASKSNGSEHLPTDIVRLDGFEFILADRWVHEDHLEIGTIVAGGFVCFETRVYPNGNDSARIEGPTTCRGRTKMALLDTAIEQSFKSTMAARAAASQVR